MLKRLIFLPLNIVNLSIRVKIIRKPIIRKQR